ncbi:MAG: glycosyltransferase family 2 protein [Sedimenticola sp.]
MRIGVVIPTFNRCNSVLRCLGSLRPELMPEDSVVIVDAGSTDNSVQEIMRLFPEVVCIQATSESWWADLVNTGVQRLLGDGVDYVLTFNDDNIATPGFLKNMRSAVAQHGAGIFSSVCCYMSDPQCIFFAGRKRNRWTDRFHYLDLNMDMRQLHGGIREVDLLHGMCTLIPRAIFEKIGMFDAAAFPHLFADDDFVLRAHEVGYSSLVVLDSVVLNDRTTTGYNPYDRRLGPIVAFRLFTSRRSAFQINTRVRFLWRHRRGFFRFLLTLISDYLRLISVVIARWVLPDKWFHAIGMAVNRLGSDQ